MHSGATKTKLVVRQPLEQPLITEVWQPNLDRKLAGPRFKKDAKDLETAILNMSQLELEVAKKSLEEKGEIEVKAAGKDFVVGKDILQIERVTKKENGKGSIAFRLYQSTNTLPMSLNLPLGSAVLSIP